MKYFLTTLPRNIVESFRGKNLWWHCLAIASTATIVWSGFDWYYFSITRSPIIDRTFFPAIVVGGLLPMFGPFIILFFGWLRKKASVKTLAWALGQAALAGYFISSFYKALTGRIHPPQTILEDISRQFHFGFFREGIFWGWPSSHTTVAFAMALALVTLYPKNKIVKYLSLAYAFYIGIGISFSIHWFSEFVAGAIFGSVIGIVVGKSFKQKLTDN